MSIYRFLAIDTHRKEQTMRHDNFNIYLRVISLESLPRAPCSLYQFSVAILYDDHPPACDRAPRGSGCSRSRRGHRSAHSNIGSIHRASKSCRLSSPRDWQHTQSASNEDADTMIRPLGERGRRPPVPSSTCALWETSAGAGFAGV